MVSMIRIGLNPYGIAYSMGLMPHGPARPNPDPITLDGYIDLARRIGAAGIELPQPLLAREDEAAIPRLRQRLAELGYWIVISHHPPIATIDRSIAIARALGAGVIRTSLTSILCGDRADPACDWPRLYASARRDLREAAARAADAGLIIAVENHQDLTSHDLLVLCETCGPAVRISLDCGNALAVAEDPIDFARTVAPKVSHIHLKDYRAHFSDDGYRLIRCPIGDGCVPFAEMAAILDSPRPLTASIEPGALEARYIRCFTPAWWRHYEPRAAERFAAALRAARRGRWDEAEDWRTPWELGAPPGQIIQYETDQLQRSVANLISLGLMPESTAT